MAAPGVPESMLALLPPPATLLAGLPPEGQEVYCIRHAHPFDYTASFGSQRRQTVYGSHASEVRLSELGLRQAMEARDFWGNHGPCPAVVVASPLKRARDTAEIVIIENYMVLPPPLVLDDRLEDNRLGTKWLNIPRAYWTKHREELWRMQLCSDGLHGEPENPYQTQARAVQALFDHLSRQPGKRMVFVSHGDVICFIFQYLECEPIMNLVGYHDRRAVDKCTIWRLVLHPDRPVEISLVFKPTKEGLVYQPD